MGVKLLHLWLVAALQFGIAGQAQAQASRAEWVTLGTSGGPAVRVERSQIANALVVEGDVYLFDAGNGVQRQMALAMLDERRIKAVFLSHHHLDHNADLGPLIVTHWTFGRGKLRILGPAGTKGLAEGLAGANAPTVLAAFPTGGPAKPGIQQTIDASDLPAAIERPRLVFEDGKIKVWAVEVDHFQMPPSVPMAVMPKAVGYRIEAGGRTFAYTGDTGPSRRMIELAKGVDTLVTEVVELEAISRQLDTAMAAAPAAVREGIVKGMTVNHLTAVEVGNLARAAEVGQVVVTHFVPSPEAGVYDDAYRRGIGESYKGRVRLARDLDRF